MHWLRPDLVFDGQRLRADLAVGFVDGVAVQIGRAQGQAVRGTITPGFVDLQVNGGGGVLVNNDPSAAGLNTIAAAHRGFGTVAILPTVITDSADVMVRAVDAVLASDTPAILGLHIEGPHIAPARRGTHDLRHIRPLNAATIAQIERLLNAGKVAKITLAPEAVLPGQVRALVQMGAVVCIGHSDASADQTRALLAEGAQGFTHLFNAMSQMTGRAPGVVGAAILSDAYCGLICDGHHVADDMIRLAIRARPKADLMFLVSDAMATVGGPDHFSLYGQTITLSNGRLINAEGALAGAHLTMAAALRRMAQIAGPEQALRMATSTPAALIGRAGHGALIGRAAHDIVVLDADWQHIGFCDALI